jgi:hypothetical protein
VETRGCLVTNAKKIMDVQQASTMASRPKLDFSFIKSYVKLDLFRVFK